MACNFHSNTENTTMEYLLPLLKHKTCNVVIMLSIEVVKRTQRSCFLSRDNFIIQYTKHVVRFRAAK